MRPVLTLLCTALLLTTWSLSNSEARPKKRLDPRTKMCRELTKMPLEWESETWGNGGKKFRAVCQSCHSAGDDAKAPFIHAETHTSEGWNRVFSKRLVKCSRNGSWASLSTEDIMQVNDYLYRNGDWTYDPNDADSCG
ncbi:MAG: hypothetical protein ABFS19_11070 [Thermodesulfobacteriota bacterium]